MQLFLQIARQWLIGSALLLVALVVVELTCDFSIARPALTVSNHKVPITDLLVLEQRIYSCSQIGIQHTKLDGADSQKLIANPFRIYSMAKMPGESGNIAVGGGRPGEAGVVAIIECASGKILAQRIVSKDLVYSISIDPKTDTLGAACNDGRIVTVPLSKLEDAPVTTRHQHTAIARGVAFSPNGKQVLVTSAHGRATIRPAP